MSSLITVRTWGLILVLLGMAAHAGQEQPRLYGRSTIVTDELELTDADRRWLWSRRTLRLGVAVPDYPPFDITGTGREYEGITADYSSLIAQLLNLRVEVRRYDSRAAAIAGLKGGEIDLLGTSNAFEAAVADLTLSQAYARDQPILATRRDDQAALDPTRPGKKLAMLDNYLPPEIIRRLYPLAEPVTFASTLSALGAVAFGQADFYLGNALGTHYLVNKSQLDNVELAHFAPVELNHFGFALAPRSSRLLTLVNAALQAIPASERTTILQRWSVGGVNIRPREPLRLSAAERRWLQKHPRVRVAIDEQFLPVSYRDAQGRFRGVSADVLDKISLKSGLQFDVVKGSSTEQMIQQMRRGEVDLLAALPSSRAREERLSFTRAYLSNSLVLVTADEHNSPVSFEQLAGQRLAVVEGGYLSDYLREHFPLIQLREVDSPDQAMAWVAEGKAKAAAVTLIGARYAISTTYPGRLRVSASLPVEPAHFAFATDRGAWELLSILNKTLLSIDPQEMDELTQRWRSEVIIADSYWQKYRWLIVQGFAVAAGLLLLAIVWIRYLRKLIGQREEARQDAEAANRAKTVFLATMSHEIRTPMNAVLGMLELALRKAEQGVLDRLAIEVASGAARGLLELIGDILDITRIESGDLVLTPQRTHLRQQVESVVRLFEGQARLKHVHLALEVEGDVDSEVLLDPLRFKQILSNLISNAIKFTHEGEVRVRLRADTHGERVALHLTVEDSGVGIPESDLAQLGNPFRQASNNQQSARQGSGLGLSISRTLCDMMGGQMRLESTLGVGTRAEVRLELPWLPSLQRPSVAPSPACDAHGPVLSILVVDDYPANRLLLHQQLGYLGHRVVAAEEGSEGLRVWLSQCFDVVISDCNMPGLSGYDLARAIREDERRKKKPASLILGFTANAQADERQRCLEAGMNDCLFKPLSLEALAEKLAMAIPHTGFGSTRDDNSLDEGIDLSSLKQLTAGDLPSIKLLLNDLLLSNRQDLQRLAMLNGARDRGGLADLVHRVKGGARIIKAVRVLHACEQLEQACASNAPDLLVEQQIDEFGNAMRQLAESLERYCSR